MNNMIRIVLWLYLIHAVVLVEYYSQSSELFPVYVPAIDLITQDTKNELSSRYGVKGAMGGNVTLTSIAPIATGKAGFIYSGDVNGNPVVIKFMKNSTLFKREHKCYDRMGATFNKDCEKYGITYIYHTDTFLSYKTMVMTKLDTDVLSLRDKIGSFSDDAILIIFRDLIRTLKYTHSKGIINGDIKPKNIMVKGADLFVIDYNLCTQKAFEGRISRGSRLYMSIGEHLKKPPAEHQDMESLLYVMLVLADAQLPWNKSLTHDQIRDAKQSVTVDSLCGRLERVELIDLYKQFYTEVFASEQEKRLPQYDDLYKIFDGALYSGRNRSERIVFEWLSAESKLKAMAEDVPSIESIVFS